ncbi:MAG: CotH kinase family protein [bacterium]|nr:CotH kinase family protein [bacterium]
MSANRTCLLSCFGIAIFFLCIQCTEDPPKATSLPQIHLTCDEENLNTGDYQVEDLIWYDTLGNRIWGEKIRLRARGNRSATFEKHSFSLKASADMEMLGMPKNKKWKLNAEYIDKTFMRNKLSYDLFRSFSPGNWAARVKYCVVYMNDEYQGVYAMTQSVDASNLELDGEGAVLFKEPPVSHPPVEHEERFEKFKTYVQRSSRYKDYSIKARYKLEDECYFNQRHPDIKKENYSDEIYRLTEFIFNSSDADFSDPNQFNQYFDLDNLIDWHLLILVTANGDGTYKNFYMSRKEKGEPYIFTPWDYDHSFGRDGDGEPSKISIIPVKKNMALLHRLVETNAFDYRTKLYEKFLNLKKSGVLTDKNIHKMIDANVAVLKPEIKDNEKRWPLDEIDYFQNASFETEVQRMKNWITNHLPKLEEYLREQSALDIRNQTRDN